MSAVPHRIVVAVLFGTLGPQQVENQRILQEGRRDVGHRAVHRHPGSRVALLGRDDLDPLAREVREPDVRMVLHRLVVVAVEVRTFVDDQRVVGHGLHGERFVLVRIVSLVLGLDVEPAGRPVITEHLVAVVVVGEGKLVVVSVAQAVGRGLEGDGAVQRGVRRADHRYPTLVAVAAVAVEGTVEGQRLGLSAGDVARHGKTGIRREHPVLITGRHVKQRLVRRIGVVGDVHGIDQLLRVVALQQRIVEAHETSVVSQLEERRNGLQQNSVTILEDLQIGPVVVDALREDHEGPDGVTLVVGTLGEVTVGREEVVELLDESAVLARLIGSVEGLAHQLLVAHGHTDHADGRRGPRGMVVHLVEDLVVAAVPLHAVHQEVSHRSEKVPFHIGTFLRRHVVVDAVVGHRGVDQPDAFVERLPEDAARGLRQRDGMEPERRIEVGIGLQHVGHAAGILLLTGHLPGDAAVDHFVVVEFVAFVGVAAPAVAGLRNLDLRRQRGIRTGERPGHGGIEGRDLAPGLAHLGNPFGREQQRRMRRPGAERHHRCEECKQEFFHDLIPFLRRFPNGPAGCRPAARSRNVRHRHRPVRVHRVCP